MMFSNANFVSYNDADDPHCDCRSAETWHLGYQSKPMPLYGISVSFRYAGATMGASALKAHDHYDLRTAKT
jgi:hypothetical protein